MSRFPLVAVAFAFLPAFLGAGEVVATTGDVSLAQKIQTLTFDRRPSAMLKALNTPVSADTAPVSMDASFASFARSVTLGQWEAVRGFLASLDTPTSETLYAHLLTSLLAGPPEAAQTMALISQVKLLKTQVDTIQIKTQIDQMKAQPGYRGEINVFGIEDIVALANLAPAKISQSTLMALCGILEQGLDSGLPVEQVLSCLKREVTTGGDGRLTRRRAALLLDGAGLAIQAQAFLPELEEARVAGDFEALNLLTRMHKALHAKHGDEDSRMKAWTSCLAVLGLDASDEGRKTALRLAVELAPNIDKNLGAQWLMESFTQHPERGMEILATIGMASSQGLTSHAEDPESRLRILKLQVTAVTALLASSPQSAGNWSGILDLFSRCWLQEAALSHDLDTSVASAQVRQQDAYGNLFYMSQQSYSNQPGMAKPIRIADVLLAAPPEAWMGKGRGSTAAQLRVMKARLLIKSGDVDAALPLIEAIAPDHPEAAKDLVCDFLKAWSVDHDPNASNVRQFSMVFTGSGWAQRAEGIPLTRSKQQRNLVELKAVVAKLRELPVSELDEALLVRAFTTCHSSAEVYSLEAIRGVFGPLENLKPVTLASLIQGMRTNLGKLWRSEEVQQANKTKRRKKDIEAEVLHGYEVASMLAADALAQHKDEWSLLAAKAALAHDENEYQRELTGGDDGTSLRRIAALDALHEAAGHYSALAAGLSFDKMSTEVFELWFHAGLGACDPQNISHENAPDPRQPALIRDMLYSFKGPVLERHLELFSMALNARLSSIKPSVKHRYLKAGFEIIGNHEKAQAARKVFDYYSDLVSEIKLETALDGPDKVDAASPFGVFVTIRHTREIERESGGFGRYLQNQNNTMYSYNFGRPTENYREKFEEAARQALGEGFEILSVTFQDDKVHSRATPVDGWRQTPYAYLLLKVRRPEVDMLPSLKLDLDFIDTSGYVVLPVESPPLPLEASAPSNEPRPFSQLNVVQTLDERQSSDGKLILEVRATARGLVPELGQILKVDSPGFEVTETDAQPVAVTSFDPDSSVNAVVSGRHWLVSMRAKGELEKRPESFHFATPIIAAVSSVTQRYEDANLVTVPQEILLKERYGEPSRRGWWMGGGALALMVVGLGVYRRRRGKAVESVDETFHVPSDLNPFTLIALLRKIQRDGRLNPADSSELQGVIERIEKDHFSGADVTGSPDLGTMARSWATRVAPKVRVNP